MKISLLFTLAAALMVSATHPVSTPTDDLATVYLYRTGQFMAAANNYVIFANGERICRLSNNKYIEHRVKPGQVQYEAKIGGVEVFKKKTLIDLSVEAGKKYYIRCDVKASITRTRLEMSEVTENTAKRDMADMSVDRCQEKMEGQ